MENPILQHTLARPEEGYKFVLAVYKEITAHAVVIREVSTAAFRIDEGIRIALCARNPVYIEIACNLASAIISRPNTLSLMPTHKSDPGTLKKALLLYKVVGVGTCSGADIDKFEKFGLTPVKGKHISPRLKLKSNRKNRRKIIFPWVEPRLFL